MRDKAEHAERQHARVRGKAAWIRAYGPIPRDEKGRPFQLHHKDRNWRNYAVENLECLSRKEHDALHREERIATVKKHLSAYLVGNKFGRANRGKVRSPEARKKVSEARTGVPLSEATKRKIAASSLGLNKGRKKSPEEIARREATKAAKRANAPARKHTPETKAKMSAARHRWWADPAERAKSSARALLRYANPDERAKASAAAVRREAAKRAAKAK